MPITIQVLTWYAVQDIFEDYSSNMAPFFSEVGLRKFVLASELFVSRPYFIRHLTAKWDANISWFPLQFPFQRKWSKSELRTKNWNYTHLLSNLAREGVDKRFFNHSSFYIGIKFHVKVNSSLARSLQIEVDNRAECNF